MLEDTSQIERTNQHQPNKASESHDCYTNLKPALSNCSCPECDSLECFIRRELTNSVCNCNDKSQSCFQYCNNNENKTKKIVNKRADFFNEINYQNEHKSTNGEIDKTIQSKFSRESITEISQEYFKADVDNAPVMIPLKKLSNTTAELSAQIMNVSFEDLNDSISINQPYRDSLTQLSDKKQDILSRLKEIYKACSCKVCECIPIKSFFTPSDTCSCKPCQCSECRHSYRYDMNIKENPHYGCPCIRCDRKDCGGVTKNTLWNQTCDCKPCDCLKCTDFYSTHCDCEPCTCLECKSKAIHLTKSFVVASVEQNTQGNLCNCETPCECSNCVPNYGTTGTLQERSTGTATLSICPCDTCIYDSCQSDGENCRCETQKSILTKPIQRNRYDYDIRNVLIKEHSMWSNKQREKNQNDVNVEFNLSMGVESGQNLTLQNKMCRCVSCECYACNKYHQTTKKQSRNNSNQCLHCEDLKFIQNEKFSGLALQKLIPSSDRLNNSYEYFNILKSDDDIRIHLIENNKNITPSSQIPLNVFSKEISSSKQSRQNMCVCQTFSKHAFYFNQSYKQTVDDNNSSRSVFYATAQNSALSINLKKDIKVRSQNTELSLSRRKKLYCVASILKDMSLFSHVSNTSLIQNDDGKYSSLHNLLPPSQHAVVPTFKDVTERLDNGLNFELSGIKSNYFMKSSCIKYFNALFDENQNINEDNDNTFDYGKIFKTLREAQDFSMKLNRILEIYEKANTNFISVSQRLNILYEGILKNSESGFSKYTHTSYPYIRFNNNSDLDKTYCVGDTQLLSYKLDVISSNLNVSATTSRSSKNKVTTLKPNLGSHNLLENVECIGFQGSGSVERYEHADSNDTVLAEHRMNGTHFNSKSDLVMNRIKSEGRKICGDLYKNPKLILKNNSYLQKRDNSTDTDSSFLYPRLSTCNRSVSTENGHSKQDKNLNTTITISFRDADFYKDTPLPIETCNILEKIHDKHYEDIDVTPSKIDKKTESNLEIKKFNVFRKNLYLKSETQTQNNNNFDIPLFELNVKQIIGIISQEIRKEYIQENLNCCRFYKSLEEKVYENVRTLLNQMISTVVLKSELTSIKRKSPNQSLVKIKSTNNNETMKAFFSDLRRVSDHTVLVKWTIPKNISHIRGYEVDGRAVKKIFSPNNSMAVVTCLPHSDKVLLTILTLYTSNDSYKSNTIVYNPRKKTR